ncbi:RHS repeat-associated core domain-containing protein [Pseudomonas sp. SDO5532_S415]
MAQPKPINQQNPTRQRTVLLAPDLKNSVIAELDAGSLNQIAYSPYGQKSAQHEVITRLGLNGELCEAEIEWYLLGNGYRTYNPRLMRFHSPDSWSPFGRGGLNAYMYCGGEPVLRSDPTGRWFGAGIKELITNLVSSTSKTLNVVSSNVQKLAGTMSGNVHRMIADSPNAPNQLMDTLKIIAGKKLLPLTGNAPSPLDIKTAVVNTRKQVLPPPKPSAGLHSNMGQASSTQGSGNPTSSGSGGYSSGDSGNGFQRSEGTFSRVGGYTGNNGSSYNVPSSSTWKKTYYHPKSGKPISKTEWDSIPKK